MRFLHDDPSWPDLLRIVADARGIPVALVEKDYWVTHVLWAILEQGFEVWFKGGTSLSKGFGLIQRFSEDIDVRIDAGRVEGLVEPVLSWNNRKRGPTERDAWFDALAAAFEVPACTTERDAAGSDEWVRSACYRSDTQASTRTSCPRRCDPSCCWRWGERGSCPSSSGR